MMVTAAQPCRYTENDVPASNFKRAARIRCGNGKRTPSLPLLKCAPRQSLPVHFLSTHTDAASAQWKCHLQMPLIRAGHSSHHYAALCKLQLIPAYYPRARSICFVAGSLAAAEEERRCPSEEVHLTYNPCCFKDATPQGLVNVNQVGTRSPRARRLTSLFLREPVPSKAGRRREREGQTPRLVSF